MKKICRYSTLFLNVSRFGYMEPHGRQDQTINLNINYHYKKQLQVCWIVETPIFKKNSAIYIFKHRFNKQRF